MSAPRICAFVAALLIIGATGVAVCEVISVPGMANNIQQGLQLVVSGDTVSVRRGSYFGTGFRDIVLPSGHVVLMSQEGAALTVLNCQGSQSSQHRAFLLTDGGSSIVEIRGFTIKTGYATEGGAVFCVDGFTCTFRDCIFEYNSALRNGGAVFVRNATAVFINCQFRNNFASGGTTGGGGAGSVEVHNGSASFIQCKFIGNTSGTRRGAINSERSTISISQCEFTNNDGYGDYGPFDYNLGVVGIGTSSEAWISDCLFASNHGFAIGVSGATLHLQKSTIVDNCGGLYTWYSTCDIQRTIIAFSSRHESVMSAGWSHFTIGCSDFFGNYLADWPQRIANHKDANGNFSADPRFCDRTGGNYNLHNYSACAPEYNFCGVRVGRYPVQCTSDYTCGDVSFSGEIEIDDAVYLINYVFLGGLQPIPYVSGDADCNGYIDIDDVVYMISYIFADGPAPCVDCD